MSRCTSWSVPVPCEDDITIETGQKIHIPTGITIEMPERYYIEIESPQSSLNITCNVANQLIDNSNHDPVHVYMNNMRTKSSSIKKDDCIASMVYEKAIIPAINQRYPFHQADSRPRFIKQRCHSKRRTYPIHMRKTHIQ